MFGIRVVNVYTSVVPHILFLLVQPDTTQNDPLITMGHVRTLKFVFKTTVSGSHVATSAATLTTQRPNTSKF